MMTKFRMFKYIIVFLALLLVFGLFTHTASAQTQRIHVVQRGETLRNIAAFYGTTWQAIATANNLFNPNLIFPGQQLVIPAAGTGVTRTYTVQRGDTLRNIAFRFNTTWQAIAEVNQLANPNRIFPGQVLTLPSVGGPVTPPPVVGGRYTVQFGDTLFKIASRFGVNLYDIAEANGILNLNRIFTGQSLIIPGR